MKPPRAGSVSAGLPVFPFNIVTNAHPLVHIKFQYAGQSNKGPYPPGTASSTGSLSAGWPARAATGAHS